jgi:hypothetical protein
MPGEALGRRVKTVEKRTFHRFNVFSTKTATCARIVLSSSDEFCTCRNLKFKTRVLQVWGYGGGRGAKGKTSKNRETEKRRFRIGQEEKKAKAAGWQKGFCRDFAAPACKRAKSVIP